MKKLVLSALMMVMVGLSSVSTVSAATPLADNAVVYVAPMNGECYHTHANCAGLASQKKAGTPLNAVLGVQVKTGAVVSAKGTPYRACKKCAKVAPQIMQVPAVAVQ